jgi:hypothetical protein
LLELQGERMSVRGTLNKFGLLFIMMLGSASFTWGLFYQGVNVMPLAIGSAIGGFILAIIMTFKKEWSPYLALGYALLEGLFLGAISAVFNAAFAESYPGIVMQAVLLTLGTAGACSCCTSSASFRPRLLLKNNHHGYGRHHAFLPYCHCAAAVRHSDAVPARQQCHRHWHIAVYRNHCGPEPDPGF